ncbi:hypothetical protein [Mesorhizobium sp. WSM1293]|uniref:hypothetical protein n=1 Tax=Mesorhizobium sp. WSM1293 TaxID=1040984 RepID=UPI0004B1EA1E|nr:hypothetical protein [Mesorhizobium sp. WSM1293]
MEAGLSKDGSHGDLSHAQHRVQTSGSAGVPSGETPHDLAKRHGLPRNLIRIWIQKYGAGSFDGDVAAADTMQIYEARSQRWSGW